MNNTVENLVDEFGGADEVTAETETTFDLSNFSAEELKAMQDQVAVELQNRQHQDKLVALETIIELIHSYGLNRDDLMATMANAGLFNKIVTRPGNKRPPRYLDSTTGATWSGFGKMPMWLQRYINEGRDKNEFLLCAAPTTPAA